MCTDHFRREVPKSSEAGNTENPYFSRNPCREPRRKDKERNSVSFPLPYSCERTVIGLVSFAASLLAHGGGVASHPDSHPRLDGATDLLLTGLLLFQTYENPAFVRVHVTGAEPDLLTLGLMFFLSKSTKILVRTRTLFPYAYFITCMRMAYAYGMRGCPREIQNVDEIRKTKKLRPFLLFPYAYGIVWVHFLDPLVTLYKIALKSQSRISQGNDGTRLLWLRACA